MPNRYIDDSMKFRQWTKEYLLQTDTPSLEAACQFIAAKCAEEEINPPHSSTVTRLLKREGVNPQRWSWRHNPPRE